MKQLISLSLAALTVIGASSAQAQIIVDASPCPLAPLSNLKSSDCLAVGGSAAGFKNYFIPEPATGTATPEMTAVHNLPVAGSIKSDLIGPGLLTPGAAGLTPMGALVLFEPPGSTPEPGTVFINNRPVSDILMSFGWDPAGGTNPTRFGYAFISDGSPDLPLWADFLSVHPGFASGMVETGKLIDATGFLHVPLPDPVFVFSDVEAIPEPSSVALLLGGLTAVGMLIRRQRTQS